MNDGATKPWSEDKAQIEMGEEEKKRKTIEYIFASIFISTCHLPIEKRCQTNKWKNK